REHALHTGDVFVDAVGNPVGEPTQFAFAARKGDGVELGLANIVDQTVADVVLPSGLGDAAVGQVIGPATAPLRKRYLAFHAQIRAGRVDEPELPRAGQVGANDLGYVAALGMSGKVGNRDRILGGTHPGNIDLELGLYAGGDQGGGRCEHGGRPAAPGHRVTRGAAGTFRANGRYPVEIALLELTKFGGCRAGSRGHIWFSCQSYILYMTSTCRG